MNESLSSTQQAKIRKLARIGSRNHLHLDWYSLDRWLQHPTLIAALRESDGNADAFLAAATQPSASSNEAKAAWLRVIIPPVSDSQPRALDDLWRNLRTKLLLREVTEISLLEVDGGVARYAQHWGFSLTNSVITLRRTDQSPLPLNPHNESLIRDLNRAELATITQLDWAAFSAIWRYDEEALLTASEQSATCTVLETNGQIAGYQMSTQYSESGHLARLAISPSLQGQGLGALLLSEVIRYFQHRHIHVITVNTQKDNIHSQRLYMRYGFEATGHSVPVWTLTL